jgi:hypothetical protein
MLRQSLQGPESPHQVEGRPFSSSIAAQVCTTRAWMSSEGTLIRPVCLHRTLNVRSGVSTSLRCSRGRIA